MKLNKKLLLVLVSLLPCLPLTAQVAVQKPMSESDFLASLQDMPKRALLGIQFTYQQEPGNDPTRYRLNVRAVQPGGPGELAGLRSGDAIVAAGGQPLIFSDPLEIEFFWDQVAPGQAIRLGMLRGTEFHELELIAAELPPELASAKARDRRRVLLGAGIETAEKLGRGTGVPLKVKREGETGRLSVELMASSPRLSALRLAALTVAFEDSRLFPAARAVEAGREVEFHLHYDNAITTFTLEPKLQSSGQ